MSRFEWITLALQVFTLGFASYFAFIQNTVNERLARLEDYVSVTAVPDASGVKFINTGGSNVYIHEIEVDGAITSYEKPRQIAAKAGDVSSYFLPITLETANKDSFFIRLKLTDEFGEHWVSEHGGGAADQNPSEGAFTVWTYRTIKP
jgi:hypothetical protein